MRSGGTGNTPIGNDRLGPRFWTLLSSSSLSNLADGAVKISLPLLAIGLTTSPLLIGGLGVALTLPWLVFALPAGALSDRLDRRRAMMTADLARTAALAVLVTGFVSGLDSIWLLYIVAFGLGCAETVYDTSAQAILPQLVHRDQLARANGRLHAVELTANEFLGPPLGGALVVVGAAMAVAVPAGLWLCAVGALLLIPGSFRIQRATPTRMRDDISEGLRFLWSNRVLRTLAIMVGISNFAANAVFTVFVLYAVGPTSALNLSGVAYAILLAMIAVGSVTGSLLADRIERTLGRARSFALAIPATSLLLWIPAATSNQIIIGCAFILGGVGIAVWNVISISLRQRITPGRLLGRVNSAFRLLAWGTLPLGAATGGIIAETLGLTTVFVVMGAVTALLLFGLVVLTDKNIDATEDGRTPC
jgi:MFS family permease